MGIFSVLEAPDSPCPKPLPRQGVGTCGPESLSSGDLRPGPREEARRPLGPLWAVPGWWWPAVGSSGPARSSRRCPSCAAAAAAEWSGNTGHSGWSDCRCRTTSHLPGSEKGNTVKPVGLQWGQGGEGAACWPSPALDERTLAVVVRLRSEEPQLVTKAPRGLRAPPHPILVNAAFTSLTLVSYFSTLATW